MKRLIIGLLMIVSLPGAAGTLIDVREIGSPAVSTRTFACEIAGRVGTQRIKVRTQHLDFIYADGRINHGSETEHLKIVSDCRPIDLGAPYGAPPAIIPSF